MTFELVGRVPWPRLRGHANVRVPLMHAHAAREHGTHKIESHEPLVRIFKMEDSLQTLLSHCVDYAGVFPPAGLSIEESLSDYATYALTDERWLLGRFVCPVRSMSTLSARADRLREIRPRLAVVGTAAQGATEFLPSVRRASRCDITLNSPLRIK